MKTTREMIADEIRSYLAGCGKELHTFEIGRNAFEKNGLPVPGNRNELANLVDDVWQELAANGEI